VGEQGFFLLQPCNDLSCRSIAGLHSLHIHDATIDFSGKNTPITATQACRTVRFSNVNFILNSGVDGHLNDKQIHMLVAARGRNSTLTMENCVLKATFDSPSLFNLTVCMATEGGQVWGTGSLLHMLLLFCQHICAPTCAHLPVLDVFK
jgi:hypothetical protein